MIKKFYTIFFLCLLVTSCGKKGDPVYNKVEKILKETSTKKIVVL
tara:strand:+ start:498 stop:632 length:135 start_codon:yes stop_codon:yes gene_type:complete